MSALSQYLPSAPPAPPVLLARGDVFFTRRVALAADAPVADQITLALEGMAPFPPEQLYHGHLPSADGASALVFAAFRRRFSADETEAWDGAALVTAEFVPLLLSRPGGEGVTLHVGEGRVTALAWKAGEDLPVAVIVRGGGAELGPAIAADARSRGGLHPGAETLTVEGVPALRSAGEAGYEAWLGETKTGDLPAAWVAGADVRDPDFLAERRRAGVRDLWLWRGLLGAAAVLLLSAVLHLSSGVMGFLTSSRVKQVAAQQPEVEQIEAAQSLANEIGKLSQNRLMPFEMLAMINPSRPDSIVFQSFVLTNDTELTIQGQAGDASDVGTYSQALKGLPGLANVATRDVRSRDGVTSFVLALQFKPEALRNGGAM